MIITIEIDSKPKAVELFLKFVESLPYVKKVHYEKKPNLQTKIAMNDARKGKTKKVNMETDDIVKDILNS